MDRSLRLLMALRARALLRRWKKALARPKGIAMAIVTGLLFVPWIASVIMTSRLDVRVPLEPIRRYGSVALLAFTAFSLLFSAGEQALYYSPAEATFLFAGPYRKRQLLAYKLLVTVLLCLVSSIFCGLGSRLFSPSLASAFVGSFLLILFFQVLQIVVGLAASTLGALAWSRGRRVVLFGLLILVAASALTAGRGLFEDGPVAGLHRIERSPVAGAVLAPFRWFVLVFTAERAWPDLAGWSALCLAIDGALIGLVFALDAGYLEAAASASARRFARIQRMGGGGGGLRSTSTRKVGRFGFRPPDPPWWGGVGPNFWRQMTAALGDPGRMASVLLMLAVAPVMMMVMAPSKGPEAGPLTYVCLGMIAWMSILLSFLMPYDFRGDIDLMEELKALPIAPTRLALGEILTPAVVASIAQAIAIASVMIGMGGNGPAAWTVLAFLLPVNLAFYAIENLLFLHFPSRIVAGQFDVMAIGRMMLFLLAKMIGLGLGSGLAALAGVAAYFLAGRSVPAAMVGAWVAISAVALGLVPLVGRAFVQFDVSRDVPA